MERERGSRAQATAWGLAAVLLTASAMSAVPRAHAQGPPSAPWAKAIEMGREGPEDDARAVAVLPDGKILLAGAVGESWSVNDIGVARYLPDGSVDRSFGIDGAVRLDRGEDYESANTVAPGPGGKIYVLTGQDLLRLNANGHLD